MMRKTCAVFALCLASAIAPLPALAIDLQPEDGVAPRVDVNFLQFGYTNSQRGYYYLNGVKQATPTEVDLSQVHVRLARTFEWSGRPSAAYIQVPYGSIDTKNVNNAVDAPSNTGDLVMMLATWPYANKEKHEFFGVAGYLFLPTGDYDMKYTAGSVNTNLGENRYRGTLQAAYHQRIFRSVGWQVAFDTTWFGDNDEFLEGATKRVTLSRKPLYAAQTSLSYRILPQLGIGASYFYTAGGETQHNGADRNNRVSVHRYELTGFYQFPTHRITLQYGGDIKTENGFKEDRHVIVRWTQYF